MRLDGCEWKLWSLRLAKRLKTEFRCPGPFFFCALESDYCNTIIIGCLQDFEVSKIRSQSRWFFQGFGNDSWTWLLNSTPTPQLEGHSIKFSSVTSKLNPEQYGPRHCKELGAPRISCRGTCEVHCIATGIESQSHAWYLSTRNVPEKSWVKSSIAPILWAFLANKITTAIRISRESNFCTPAGDDCNLKFLFEKKRPRLSNPNSPVSTLDPRCVLRFAGVQLG